MPTIFTRIIEGEIPSRMLWEDDICVAFLDVRPLAPGHSLVVPRVEIDQWTDLPVEHAAHVMTVAHAIGRAQKTVFRPARVGLMIAGFEVPHTHVHAVPMDSMRQLDFSNADNRPDQAALDEQHQALRTQLLADGHHLGG
ncbi:MAG: HIT family protein [Acidimicrobiales bacterium]|nr:HIT family protein [Acidimicrobiales bacterium]RZV46212.1 MAG: HIT family protein [Acidimicrobiales bacterium]